MDQKDVGAGMSGAVNFIRKKYGWSFLRPIVVGPAVPSLPLIER